MPIDNPSSFPELWLGALGVVGMHCERDVEAEPTRTPGIELLTEGYFAACADGINAWRNSSSSSRQPRFYRSRVANTCNGAWDMDEHAQYQSFWAGGASVWVCFWHYRHRPIPGPRAA